uniref:Uncharacterized protein n=1 Tax=Plectus sambesii TaxID=2011161 RepID=A0A914XH13_9BILA
MRRAACLSYSGPPKQAVGFIRDSNMTIVAKMAPEEIKLPRLGLDRSEKRRKKAPLHITILPKIENRRAALKEVKNDANKRKVIKLPTLPSPEANSASKASSFATDQESIGGSKSVDEAAVTPQPTRKQRVDGAVVVRLADADAPSSSSVHEKVAQLEL